MPDDIARRKWVTRVLGLTFQTSASPDPGASRTSDIWQAAADAVGKQLGALALARALRETGIPQLTDLSRDVEGLLGGTSPTVAGALQACDRSPADAQARKAALAAIATASTWVASDRRVQAVDGNLFGVTVTAGATLGAALRQLEKQLSVEAAP
jgi:hypothetical protein